MKKTWCLLGLAALSLTACEKDDTDFSDYINAVADDDEPTPQATGNDTIFVTYSGTRATVSGSAAGYASVTAADVTVNAESSDDYLVVVLSGTTNDGSLLVYRQKKYEIILNGVSITNSDGAAINNQCGKSLYVKCADGTVNTLADGSAYAERSYDQKGALFSEGQIYFSGGGELTVTGNCKNAIASDDYITFVDDITVHANSAVGNGVKANDGVFINGGTLTVNVSGKGARGIRSEARTEITGGDVKIVTSGDCAYDAATADYKSAACIKSDSLFSMSGGTLTMTSSGDGGKCINCAENVEFSGGVLMAKTTGGNDDAKPKAVKSDTAIILSGGSFTATTSKSWACDNGTDSEEPADKVTVKGQPKTLTLTKRTVIVAFE